MQNEATAYKAPTSEFIRRLREIIGEDGDALIAFWASVVSGEVVPRKTTLDASGYPIKVEYMTVDVSISDRIAASKVIADRAFGKAPGASPTGIPTRTRPAMT